MLKPIFSLILISSFINTASAVQLLGNVEISRLSTADKTMNQVVSRYQALDEGLAQKIKRKKMKSMPLN